MKSSPVPASKNKPAIDVPINFHDVNYTSLSNDRKNNIECGRRFSIESVHDLQGLKSTSYFETLTHLIKGNVGCGILALGMTFKNGGLLLSTGMILLFSMLSCYNQYILIKMANDFKRKYNRPSISFGDTISIAFENGPPAIKRLSSFVKKFINHFIITSQLGACCVYILFITQSLKQLLSCYDISINIHISMLMVLPIIWMTSLIRHLKYIAPLSAIANFSILAALTLILHAGLSNLEPISTRKLVGRLEDLPLCFGSMIFALEGICLTLPLEQNMKNNKKFLGTFGVLNVSLVIVTVLLIMVGFFGYWKFGEKVGGSLTLNLDVEGSLLSQAVIVAMMIGIMCTYALQFFVPVLLIMPKINYYASKWPYNDNNVYEYVLRSILVLFSFLAAEIIPHFDLFLSLMGAIGGSFLAFVFCPIADLVARKKADYGKCYWNLFLAIFSLIVGFTTFIFGTIVTCKEIHITLTKDLHIT